MSSPEALSIIDRWIDTEHARGLRPQLRAFFYIRDALLGLRVPTIIWQEALDILNACKPSPEREAIIIALGDRT